MQSNKQVIPLRVLGFNGKFDSKIAPAGIMTVAENVQSSRRTGEGTVEVKKRFGFTEVTGGKTINGGGSIAACVTGAAYDDELVLLDGSKLYTRSDVLQKWVAKGRVQSIAADIFTISGNESGLGDTSLFGASSQKPNVDSAYSDGYGCFVASWNGDDDTRDARVYVVDLTTRAVVFSTTIADSYRLKVLAVSSSFYVFSWLSASGKLQCRRIQTSAPSTMSAAADVATNVAGLATFGGGVYDVAVDTTTPRMWVGYGDSSGHLVTLSWTTGNALGVGPSTYTGINPNIAMGFLRQDFSGGNGYLAVSTRVTGGSPAFVHSVHLITFSTTTAAESANTTLESYSGSSDVQSDPGQLTGYRSSGGTNNVFWTLYVKGTLAAPSAFVQNGYRAYVRGYSGGTLFDVALGLGLGTRAFTVGGKWYLGAAVQGDGIGGSQGASSPRRLLLIELDENATGTNGQISFAGLLMSADANGFPLSYSCLPSVPQPTATTAFAGVSGVLNIAGSAASVDTTHNTVTQVSLSFVGTGLGRPIQYNGLLHVPCAAHKTYDGRDVVESGFYVDPTAPGLAGAAAGEGNGQLTPGKTYQYCSTWAAFDAKGRLWRSAPGPIASVTLVDDPDPDVAENSVMVDVFNLRATDRDPKFNINGDVLRCRIEIWRTEGDLDVFYLDKVLDNDATSDYQSFTDAEIGDEFLVDNELLYTQSEEVDNQKPPAVKVLHAWQTRLFALTGDGSTWHSKESAEGFGAEFNDDFRILVTVDEGGRPTTIGSLDTSLFIFKRKRAFFTSGPGPDDKGAGQVFPAPQPLEIELGVVNATGAIDVPGGIMCETAVGRFTLTRALSFEPVEGTETYAVTIAGGVGLDSRSMTAFVTNGAVLVRDWQLSQWIAWTKTANGLAGVAIARWRNQLCIFQSDGTVLREIASQYFDGASTAINEAVEFAYTRLENARIYEMRIVGEIMSTTTITETVTYNGNASTAASKTKAVTVAEQDDLNVIPNTGRMAAIKVRIEETSTGEGFKLSQVGLEVSPKTGLRKSASSHNFT